MAKNITIQTDGTAVNYNGVKTILTTDADGKHLTWIPLDETGLAIKTVKKNGTYKAKDDGYYGYRQVTVKASGTTGTKPDGKTYFVDVDEDGNLVETVIPDRIKITTQPTKTTYADGEKISLSGAVVKAYTSETDVWDVSGYSGGVIPHSELTVEPNVAGEVVPTAQITVIWKRPQDDEELTATFTITVS